MIVTFKDNQKYRIFWEHPITEQRYQKLVQELKEKLGSFDEKDFRKKTCFVNAIYKICRCYIIDQQSKEIIAEGQAICAPEDLYSKEKARKISLKRALELAQAVLYIESDNSTSHLLGNSEKEMKESRTAIWNQYSNEIRLKGKEKVESSVKHVTVDD